MLNLGGLRDGREMEAVQETNGKQNGVVTPVASLPGAHCFPAESCACFVRAVGSRNGKMALLHNWIVLALIVECSTVES